MPSSTYLRQALMDHILNNVSYSSPLSTYLALCTSAPTADDAGDEVVGNGYARQAISVGVVGDTGVATNDTQVLFPPATPSGWGTITHFEIYDALISGNRLWYGSLTQQVLSSVASRVRILPGQVVLQIQ